MHHRWIEYFRRFPAPFWVLLAGTFINRLGSFVIPFLAIYLTQSRGYPVEQAGFVLSLYGLGSFGAGPLGGHLSDRIGRRKVLVLSLTLGACAILLLGFVSSPAMVGMAAALLGLFGEMYRPAVSAIIADLIPPRDQPRAYGMLYWVINLGFAAASAMAGLLASWNYRLLFIVNAGAMLTYGAIAFWLVPETRPAATSEKPLRFSTALKDREFLAFAGLGFLSAMVFMQFMVAMPVDMTRNGISPKHYGLLISLNGILIVLLQPSFTRLALRFRPALVLAAATTLYGIGFGLNGVISTIPLYALTIAIWTLGEILSAPLTPTIVSALAPASLRGTYQGVLQMGWGGAAFLAPALGSAILGRFSSFTLWTSCAAVCLLVALGHLWITGGMEKRGRIKSTFSGTLRRSS